MSNDIRFHIPVMSEEVIKGLDIQEGKKYIDATLGGGGHGMEIVKRGGRLLGIDQDREALEFAKQNLKSQISNLKLKDADWKIVQGNFRDIEKIAKENGYDDADGILFDLGVSSHQLDEGERGFSYRFGEKVFDLRMNQKSGVSAKDQLARLGEEEIYEILARYGEEERARAIAHAITVARRLRPIETTGDVVRIVSDVYKDQKIRFGALSRVFQAFRIVVNDELGSLKDGLSGAEKLLVGGGRLVVISYHSLEDRIVKLYMRNKNFYERTKQPIRPTPAEIQQNPRARSAKLRTAVKL